MKKKIKQIISLHRAKTGLASLVAIALSLSSCTNSQNVSIGKAGKSTTSTSTLPSTPTSSSNPLTITALTISAGSSNKKESKVYLESKDSTKTITNLCSGTGTCGCSYSWTQVVNNGGVAQNLIRSDKTVVTTLQPFYVVCDAPAFFDSIPSTAVIRTSIIKLATNERLTGIFNYSKITASESADFRSENGEALQNIHSYYCTEKNLLSPSVVNQTAQVTNTSTGDVRDVLLATSFCANTSKGLTHTTGCDHVSSSIVNSAKSDVFNLYVESSRLGKINRSNSKYECPKVMEGIRGGTTIGTQGDFYPLDTTFAVSKTNSGLFTEPILARTVLGIQDDPTSKNGDCTGAAATGGGGGDPTGIATQCLGFGIKPNTDGTCPSFRDSNGLTRNTYRLRRYAALYPPTFEPNGAIVAQPQAVDVVYVLDMPVKSNDPLHPFTMKGPLPCPYSYFDYSGVTNAAPSGAAAGQYNGGRPISVATNNTTWNGLNVDGLAFPSVDSSSANSCSAMLPMVNYTAQGDPNFVTLATTHSSNTTAGGVSHKFNAGGGNLIALTKVYIRPTTAWSPDYKEDTSFQVCAPQSDPFILPPLHFARRSDTNVAWCAERVATQLNTVAKLDQRHGGSATDPIIGKVKNFTSHVVKKTVNSECSFSPVAIPTGYPADPGNACGTYTNTNSVAGVAHHPTGFLIDTVGATQVCSDKTCDRTYANDITGNSPYQTMLAEPNDVENAMFNNSAFVCSITYDKNQGKAANNQSPADGCCHRDFLTGLSSGTVGGSHANDTAHMEPAPGICPAPNY